MLLLDTIVPSSLRKYNAGHLQLLLHTESLDPHNQWQNGLIVSSLSFPPLFLPKQRKKSLSFLEGKEKGRICIAATEFCSRLFASLLVVRIFLRILLLLSYKRKGKAGKMSAPRRIASAMPLQSLRGSMCSSTAASGPLLHKRTTWSWSSFIIFFFTASCGGFVSTSVFVIRRDFRPRQTRILGKDTTIEVLLLSSSFFFIPSYHQTFLF